MTQEGHQLVALPRPHSPDGLRRRQICFDQDGVGFYPSQLRYCRQQIHQLHSFDPRRRCDQIRVDDDLTRLDLAFELGPLDPHLVGLVQGDQALFVGAFRRTLGVVHSDYPGGGVGIVWVIPGASSVSIASPLATASARAVSMASLSVKLRGIGSNEAWKALLV